MSTDGLSYEISEKLAATNNFDHGQVTIDQNHRSQLVNGPLPLIFDQHFVRLDYIRKYRY